MARREDRPGVDGGTSTETQRVHPWLAFALRHGARLVISLFVVVSACFAMIHLVPGDPVRAALGTQASPEMVAAKEAQLGLDQPLLRQYADYLSGLFTGDWGTSLITDESVSSIIAARLPNSFALAGITFLLVVAIAIPLGLLLAVRTHGDRHQGSELAFTTATGIFGAIPGFVLAAGLVAGFAIWLPVFPVAGQAGPESYVLPVLSLGLAPAAMLARIVRIEGLKVLDEDYMRSAQAKRLPARLTYLRHALPNMVTAALTIGGILLTGLVVGTVLVENVFAWPGLGTTIVQSVTQKDYAVVQGVVLVIGAMVLLVNLLVDVALVLLDPRSMIKEG